MNTSLVFYIILNTVLILAGISKFYQSLQLKDKPKIKSEVEMK